MHAIISGYSCGASGEPCPGLYFRPSRSIMRGQLSKMLYGAILTTDRRYAKGTLMPNDAETAPPATRVAAGTESVPESVSAADLALAAGLIGLDFTADERALMGPGVAIQRAEYAKIRAVLLPNSVPPALTFDPRLPDMRFSMEPQAVHLDEATYPGSVTDHDALAFASVAELGTLLRNRTVTARALTELYLARLRRFDPLLHCVVTLTEERALARADQADAEIAAGGYRGPLHGIPWGVKDLLATRGYPTTWGATPFRDQLLDLDATVVARLDAAGAVLIAKLSVGALAWGDVWFGGMTRSPWNPAEGSSGSSAGSAAATAAGLVPFAIGTETLGSIVSPCTQCGVTGLRPTFGRVSRHGAMALAWSMDKIGPIARSAADCALVLAAIYGPDGHDGSVADVPFGWDARRSVRDLRIGYVAAAFAEERANAANDAAALAVLRGLAVDLIPIQLPAGPLDALGIILTAEAGAAFDELTRSGRDDLLERQIAEAWPNVFRQSRLIPAVEYIQAQRIRRQLQGALAALMGTVDAYIAPSFGGGNLLLTNLTGHPAVVVPTGLGADGNPTSITITAGLYDEAAALTVAHAYQQATAFHRRIPPAVAPGQA